MLHVRQWYPKTEQVPGASAPSTRAYELAAGYYGGIPIALCAAQVKTKFLSHTRTLRENTPTASLRETQASASSMSGFRGSAVSTEMRENSRAVKIELCRAMKKAKEEKERRAAAKAAEEAKERLRKHKEMSTIEIDAGLATVLSRSLGTPHALLEALRKAQAHVASGETSSKTISAPLKKVNLLSFTGGDAISLISALASEVLGLQPGAAATNLVEAASIERRDRPEVGQRAHNPISP